MNWETSNFSVFQCFSCFTATIEATMLGDTSNEYVEIHSTLHNRGVMT